MNFDDDDHDDVCVCDVEMVVVLNLLPWMMDDLRLFLKKCFFFSSPSFSI